jgi:ankyrin repeat protein
VGDCRSSPGTIKALVDNGADTQVTDPTGRTPLTHAINSKNLAAVKLLMKAKDFNLEAKIHGQTPLLQAAIIGDPKIIQLLLQNGVDPETRCDKGKTPLLCAVSAGHYLATKLLLGHKGILKSCLRQRMCSQTSRITMGEHRYHGPLKEDILD